MSRARKPKARPAAQPDRRPRPAAATGPRPPLLLPALIVAAAVALIWSYCGKPLWFDEAYTLLNYANKPFGTIATDYSLPNNHIGFTLIMHLWSLLIGDTAMFRIDTSVLRIPSLALATAGVIAYFLFARRAVSPEPLVAAAATFFYAAQPQVLEFSAQLRGYGPTMAYLCFALAAAAYRDRLTKWPCAAIVAACLFLANYTLPSNVWFTLPLGAGVLLYILPDDAERPTLKARLRSPEFLAMAVCIAAAFALTYAAYWPVRDQLAKHSGAQHTPAALAVNLRDNLAPHLAMLFGTVGYTSNLWINLACILLGCAVVGARWRSLPAARAAALLLAPVVVLSMPLAALLGKTGFSRNYGVAAPVFSTVQFWAAWGAVALLCEKTRLNRFRRAAIVVPLLAAVAVGGLHRLDYKKDFRPDEVMHFLAGRCAADEFIMYGGEDTQAFWYYTVANGLSFQTRFYLDVPAELRGNARKLYIVSASDAMLDAMLKEWNLTGLKPKLQPVRTIGMFRIHYLVRPGS